MPHQHAAQFALLIAPYAGWELPPGDADFSLRWARIKQAVTRVYTDLPFARKTHSASRTLRPLMTNA